MTTHVAGDQPGIAPIGTVLTDPRYRGADSAVGENQTQFGMGAPQSPPGGWPPGRPANQRRRLAILIGVIALVAVLVVVAILLFTGRKDDAGTADPVDPATPAAEQSPAPGVTQPPATDRMSVVPAGSVFDASGKGTATGSRRIRSTGDQEIAGGMRKPVMTDEGTVDVARIATITSFETFDKRVFETAAGSHLYQVQGLWTANRRILNGSIPENSKLAVVFVRGGKAITAPTHFVMTRQGDTPFEYWWLVSIPDSGPTTIMRITGPDGSHEFDVQTGKQLS